jgi:hypothetical protein
MKKPHELLPDGSIIPLDIAYEIVAHIVESPEQARRDFLMHGRGDRLPRLRWWKAVDSWINDDEELAADFLKRCELVEIQFKGLYLAVRGKVNPDNWTVEVNGEVFRVDVERTVVVNGEVLHLLVNDSFGLSRDDLIRIYPQLAPENHLAPKVREIVTALIAVFPPHGDPGLLSEDEICKRLFNDQGIWVGLSRQQPKNTRSHVARSTFREALKHVRR